VEGVAGADAVSDDDSTGDGVVGPEQAETAATTLRTMAQRHGAKLIALWAASDAPDQESGRHVPKPHRLSHARTIA
jgi:hypothetical protein